MNLRSGAVPQKAKIKQRKERRNEQAKNTMTSREEETRNSLESLMLSIKEDIAAQIKDFRSEFHQRSDETKKELLNLRHEVKEMQAALNRTREDVSSAEQRQTGRERND